MSKNSIGCLVYWPLAGDRDKISDGPERFYFGSRNELQKKKEQTKNHLFRILSFPKPVGEGKDEQGEADK